MLKNIPAVSETWNKKMCRSQSPLEKEISLLSNPFSLEFGEAKFCNALTAFQVFEHIVYFQLNQNYIV